MPGRAIGAPQGTEGCLMAERCDFTDLIATECGHCTGAEARAAQERAGDYCGNLPEQVNVEAWERGLKGRCLPFLHKETGHEDPPTPRELQRRQFGKERRIPSIAAEVHWDAGVRDDGELVMRPPGHPRFSSRTSSVEVTWLRDIHGEPLDVPPLIDDLTVAGGIL